MDKRLIVTIILFVFCGCSVDRPSRRAYNASMYQRQSSPPSHEVIEESPNGDLKVRVNGIETTGRYVNENDPEEKELRQIIESDGYIANGGTPAAW